MRRSRASSKLVAACWLALASASALPVGQANAAPLSFEIPTGSAAETLRDFGRQAGLQTLFDYEQLKSVRTQAVTGSLEPEAALTRMLAGTGLQFRFVDAETVVVVSAGADSYDSAEPRQFTGNDAEIIEQIIIRGIRTSTATKMDVSIMETPQNIQVLSSKFIEDIGADLLEDVLRHVAGVAVGGAYNGWDYFRIRGFDGISYLDGLRTDTIGLNAELYGLERIEVLKGPSSTLYGEGLLSGMVNLVSKRPRPDALFDASVSTGDFDFKEVALDAGGALNAAKSVSVRLAAVYREDGSFVDVVDGLNRIYLAPSLGWDIGESTNLTLLSSYQKDRNEIAFPLPGRGTVLPNTNGRIPLTRYIGDGTDPGASRNETRSLGYQFKHDFSESLSFRQSVRQRWRNSSVDRLLYPYFLFPDERTLERFSSSTLGNSETDDFNADTGIEIKFAAGGIRHHMTVGADFSHSTMHTLDLYDFNGGMPIDLFAPVDNGAAIIGEESASPYASKSQSLGFYVQDHVSFTERLSMMVGGRYQQVDGGSAATTDPDDAAMVGGNAFVPNLGFSYEIQPDVHAYASYSEAFKGQFAARLADGAKADPEEGVQYEIGIKAGLFDNRLNGTLSVYELTRQNVLQGDFANPGFYVLTGEQRSRGIEIDSQLLLRPNWEVIASAAYTDAEVTQDVSIPAGSQLRNVPRETLSLWSKYTFQSGVLSGLAVSLGGSYYSKQQGKDILAPTADANDIESFYLPSYTLVDANLTYQWNKTRVVLTVNNLLDKKFFSGSYDELYVLPGTPRTVRLTLGWAY